MPFTRQMAAITDKKKTLVLRDYLLRWSSSSFADPVLGYRLLQTRIIIQSRNRMTHPNSDPPMDVTLFRGDDSCAIAVTLRQLRCRPGRFRYCDGVEMALVQEDGVNAANFPRADNSGRG